MQEAERSESILEATDYSQINLNVDQNDMPPRVANSVMQFLVTKLSSGLGRVVRFVEVYRQDDE